MKISFVIPCFNVEQYIDRCIDSIDLLGLTDYEMIAVNDGSTDDTLSRLNERAKNNPSLIVINKANGGASSARNKGIEKADGDYLIFVDSDDVVLPPLAKVIAEINPQSDLVLFNVLQQFPDQPKEYRIHQQAQDNADKAELIRMDKFINAPWGKIIKHTLFNHDENRFDTSLIVCEDLPWSINILNRSQCIQTIDLDGYLYHRARSGSTSNTINEVKINGMFTAMKKGVELSKSASQPYIGLSMCAYQYILSLGYIGKCYTQYKESIHQMKFLLNYRLNRRVAVISKLACFVPLQILCRMLNRYIR